MSTLTDTLLDTSVISQLISVDEDGSRQLIREVIDLYDEDFPHAIDSLKSQMAANLLDQALKTAHKLKGSSRCVGYHQLGILCEQLESSIRSRQLDRSLDLIHQVVDTYPRSKAEILDFVYA